MLAIQDAIAKGYGFVYSSAAAGVVAAAPAVGTAPMLWNPSDSGVLLRIRKVMLGFVSGTVILSHLAYGLVLHAGASVATAGPIVSYTAAAAVGLIPGKGQASRINFAPLTVTLIAAPTYWMPNGFSAPGALAAGALVRLVDDRGDDELQIPPGVAFFPYMANAAMALTAAVAVVGIEEPLD